MQESDIQLYERLRDLVRAKKFDELDEAWLQVVEGEPRAAAFHERFARYLVNKKQLDRLGDLYSVLLDQRNSSGAHDRVFDIAEILLGMNEELEFLRPHLVTAAKGVHKDREPERVEEFLRISGLGGETPNIGGALSRFQDLAGASKGQVFRHSQWGLGVVTDLDARQGSAILDFPRKKGHRMTIEGIKNYLIRIPNEHVLARIARTQEEFKAEAFEDPASAVRVTLKSYGGKIKAADMKKAFLEGLMTDAEYKKWWGKAREEMRLDPWIDTKGSGLNMEIILRKEPRSFIDEVKDQLVAANDPASRRTVLRDIARHGADAELTEEDVDRLFALFRQPVDDDKLEDDAELFAHGLLFEEYSDLFPEGAENPVNVDEMLAREDVGELISGAAVFELQRRALERLFVMKNDDAAVAQICSEVVIDGEPRLTSWIEKALEQRGLEEMRSYCLERVLARPERNPEAFIWIAKNIIEGTFSHLHEAFPPIMILEEILSVMAELEEELDRAETAEEEKDIEKALGRFRGMLQENHSKFIRLAVKQATGEEARKFLTQVNMHRTLPNQLRDAAEHLVHDAHPDLKKPSRQEEEEERRRPAYHYALNDSVENKRRELSHILNVEIPQNSEAIGIARELGDLRENAEYHAAKDRQKLLMQQAAELEELIARARVVEGDQVRTDQVRFGTRVRLFNHGEKKEEAITLLGIWEADPSQQIISYLTPMGSQVMNRKVGDKFDVQLPGDRKEKYEILGIEKAI
ncbi:transcription elongation factor GreA [bacterium]|nr:transcription elongation factor GreA [bacterium]